MVLKIDHLTFISSKFCSLGKCGMQMSEEIIDRDSLATKVLGIEQLLARVLLAFVLGVYEFCALSVELS